MYNESKYGYNSDSIKKAKKKKNNNIIIQIG